MPAETKKTKTSAWRETTLIVATLLVSHDYIFGPYPGPLYLPTVLFLNLLVACSLYKYLCRCSLFCFVFCKLRFCANVCQSMGDWGMSRLENVIPMSPSVSFLWITDSLNLPIQNSILPGAKTFAIQVTGKKINQMKEQNWGGGEREVNICFAVLQ